MHKADRSEAGPHALLRLDLAAIALVVIGGVVLRLMAARGDLWLDELWSLDLVSRINSPDQVFWNISHDNNHFLNSLWMYALGPDASPLAYRSLSVVFSTAAILVAARIGARVNTAAMISAAVLAACSYTMVDYGSEARGYAGLILAVLLALDVVEMAVAPLLAKDPGRIRALAWQLAATVLFGSCAHLTMLAVVAVLGLSLVLRLISAGLPVRQALDAGVTLFRPALLLLAPLLALVLLGLKAQGGFTVGGMVPFSAAHFAEGYGGLVRTLLGLPFEVPAWCALAIAGVTVAGALAFGLLERKWIPLAGVALVVWPAMVFAARLPNTEHARYFLAAGLPLLLFLAEIAGRLWARGGSSRFAAVCLVTCVSLGQVPYLRDLLVDHRGAPKEAVALMGRDGPVRFQTKTEAFTNPVVDIYATKLGVDVKPVAGCQNTADWDIFDSDYRRTVPEQLEDAACGGHYVKVRSFPAPLWSGRSWTLYRRAP